MATKIIEGFYHLQITKQKKSLTNILISLFVYTEGTNSLSTILLRLKYRHRQKMLRSKSVYRRSHKC